MLVFNFLNKDYFGMQIVTENCETSLAETDHTKSIRWFLCLDKQIQLFNKGYNIIEHAISTLESGPVSPRPETYKDIQALWESESPSVTTTQMMSYSTALSTLNEP